MEYLIRLTNLQGHSWALTATEEQYNGYKMMNCLAKVEIIMRLKKKWHTASNTSVS